MRVDDGRGGGVTRITYGPDGEVQTESDPLGNTVTNSFDNNGNLLSTVTATGVATINTYDPHNQLRRVAQTSAAGLPDQPPPTKGGPPSGPMAVTYFDYDSFGYLKSTTSPTNVTTALTYDANGNPKGTSFTWANPNNSSDTHVVTTSAVFDGNDRQSSATDQYGHPSLTYYDPKGRVTQTVDVLGNATNMVYDARDQVIQTTNPDQTITDTVYDAEGRVSYTDDPHVAGHPVRGTHTTHDSMGRVTKTERLDNIVITISNNQGVYSSQVGQPLGNVVSTTQTFYNDLGQVTQTIDAATQPTSYQYDADGRQTAVTDALSETTKTGYDAAGRRTSTTDASNHTTQYALDGEGRVTQTTFADGSFTQMTYDGLGRESSVTDQMAYGQKTRTALSCRKSGASRLL